MGYQSPRVSIGLPLFNGQNYLATALDSLLAQTYQDFELIISDNGSTDKSKEICETYAEQDPRIRYYRSQENRGATWNYNYVFQLAQGEYFKWAAHDDLCAPEYLARCVEVLDRQPEVVLCFPKTVIIDEDGYPVEEYPNRLNLRSPQPHRRLQAFLRGPGLCNPVFGLMRIKALATTSLIESYVDSDRILLAQLALRGQFYEVPEPLFFRRLHPQTSVNANLEYGKRVAWFDPAKRRRSIYLPRWRRVIEYIVSIHRAPLTPSERALCYIHLGRRYLLHPRWIVQDFQVAVQQFLH